jgi:hypothetical protein
LWKATQCHIDPRLVPSPHLISFLISFSSSLLLLSFLLSVSSWLSALFVRSVLRAPAGQHQQVVKHSASHLFSSSRFLHRFCCAYSLLPLARLDTLFVRSAFCSLAIQVALACPTCTCSCSCSFESSLRPLPCPPCIFCARLKGTINDQSVGDQHCWSLRAVVKPRHRPPERLSGSGSRGCRCRR